MSSTTATTRSGAGAGATTKASACRLPREKKKPEYYEAVPAPNPRLISPRGQAASGQDESVKQQVNVGPKNQPGTKPVKNTKGIQGTKGIKVRSTPCSSLPPLCRLPLTACMHRSRSQQPRPRVAAAAHPQAR